MIGKVICYALLVNVVLVTAQSNASFSVDPQKIHFVEKAWAINTSGDRVPSYYSIKVNNRTFPGIRPFELRWSPGQKAAHRLRRNRERPPPYHSKPAQNLRRMVD